MDYTFKGSDNETYTLSPLTFKDRTDLRNFVQYREYQQFKESKGFFPPHEYNELAASLTVHCSRKGTIQIVQETDEFLNSLDGKAYTMYLHLRHAHPSMTPDKVTTIVDENNIQDVINICNILNPVDDKGDDSKKKALDPPIGT